MAMSVVIDGETLNVINVYTPQVGLSNEVKKSLWDSLDELSGGHNNQIDYMLVKRGNFRSCKDYMVFLANTFRVSVSEVQSVPVKESDTDKMWNTLAHIIKDATKDSLDDRDMAKERYKLAKSEAKKAVAQAKDKAYEDLYKRLDSKEGENGVYKIAKAQERRRKDLGNIKYIKDEGG
ncbi:hypothetical protein Tco_0247041 [Tanacetum coccineum]